MCSLGCSSEKEQFGSYIFALDNWQKENIEPLQYRSTHPSLEARQVAQSIIGMLMLYFWIELLNIEHWHIELLIVEQ